MLGWFEHSNGERLMAQASLSKRILFVDDDPLVRRALGAMLRHLGWEVTVMDDPRAALSAIVDGGTFDVLLTDQEMPYMQGTKLSEAVRKLAPQIRIVLCSGSLRLTKDELSHHGIDAMLTKPVSQDSLVLALEHGA